MLCAENARFSQTCVSIELVGSRLAKPSDYTHNPGRNTAPGAHNQVNECNGDVTTVTHSLSFLRGRTNPQSAGITSGLPTNRELAARSDHFL
jgi:hypothetical protein